MKAKETRIAIQRILASGLVPDGVFGSKTDAVWAKLKTAPADSEWPPRPVDPVSDTFDDRTEKNLATLLPAVQERARVFLSKARTWLEQHGVEIKVISGTRTYAEQDALYAKGRTAPGPIVTKARGGYSNHNFGLAFDVGLFKNGKYLEESPLYNQISSLAKAAGLLWGGDWSSFKDTPHYEYNPNGYTLAQLRDRVRAGQDLIV